MLMKTNMKRLMNYEQMMLDIDLIKKDKWVLRHGVDENMPIVYRNGDKD